MIAEFVSSSDAAAVCPQNDQPRWRAGNRTGTGGEVLTAIIEKRECEGGFA